MEEEIKTCTYKKYNNSKKEYNYCKLPICRNKNNLPFCGNHLPLGEIGPYGLMVKCEFCNQIIGQEKYKKHKAKCESSINAKKVQLESINSSNSEIITPRLWIKKEIKINDIPLEIINSLKNKIELLYNKININIDKRITIPDELKNKFTTDELKGKNSKNIFQEISIYGNLLKENYIKTNNLFIELGCGAASLSKTIQLACDYNSSHLLIDRMKYRSNNKCDGVMKSRLFKSKNENKNFIIREQIDIKDLDMNKYINEQIDNYAFVSKHLCGNACELSLNKIIKFRKDNIGLKSICFCIATCCHYLLDNNNYSNVDFFVENGFSLEEFNYLTRLSSWGTLNDIDNKNYKLGKMIKNMLDYGRIDYLIKNNCKNVKIIEYTDQTKENTIIIGEI